MRAGHATEEDVGFDGLHGAELLADAEATTCSAFVFLLGPSAGRT
jgi:hypothetical protein